MLEGYVTPLLTSYLQKYVKNIKPTDLKLSLWGGDVVLNNLELRLDVLEELVPIPIKFSSGRIRELSIHVPWTALGYEPVVVSINTIECVLEWNESHGKSTPANPPPTPNASVDIKAAQQEAAAAAGAPPGYVQGLINKITNNFTINVTNLVLKYVEDDMVLSVSVPEVGFGPADSDWKKAFVDVSSPACVLRKLFTVQDLTLCLDGRTSSGSIDVYQEPLLYKCSFSCRMLSNNDPAAIDRYALGTIAEVFVDRGELSINDWQLPKLTCIVMRFYNQYKAKVSAIDAAALSGHSMPMSLDGRDTASGDNLTDLSSSPVHSGNVTPSSSGHDDSWTSWAWSMVGASNESAKSPVEMRAYNLQPDKRVSIGLFVRHGTITLKQLQGTQQSSKLRRQKCIGVPCIVWDLQRSILSIVAEGSHFYDTRIGIGSAVASWIRHAGPDAEAELFFQLGSLSGTDNQFLDGTLFENSLLPGVDTGTDVDGASGGGSGDSKATPVAKLTAGDEAGGDAPAKQGGAPGGEGSVQDSSSVSDVDVGLRLYQVHPEMKQANVFSALWFNYRYVLPYHDGTVPGQHALEVTAAASGNKPSTGPPMSGEGGYGEGVVESAKQRLLVGASWLLLSEDVLQRVKLFTKSDDNSNAASVHQESSVDPSSPVQTSTPNYLAVGSFLRATTVVHMTLSKVQVLYSCSPPSPLSTALKTPASSQHSAPRRSSSSSGPGATTPTSSFKWAPTTPSAASGEASSHVTGFVHGSAFRQRSVMWVDASRIDWQITRAMYWPRFSRVSPSLLKLAVLPSQCYSETVIKSFGTSMGLAWLDDARNVTMKTGFVQPTTLSLYTRTLLVPESMVSDLALRQESRYEVPHLQLQATLSEAVLAMRFLRLATGNTGLTRSEAGLAVQAMHDLTVNVLSADPDAQRDQQDFFRITADGLQYSTFTNPSMNAKSCSMASLHLAIKQADSRQDLVVLSGPASTARVSEGNMFTTTASEPSATSSDILLQITVQHPQRLDSSAGCPGLVLAKVSGVAVNCDTELQSWLLSSLNKLQDACSSSGSATAGGVTPHKPIVHRITQASLSGLPALKFDEVDSREVPADAPAGSGQDVSSNRSGGKLSSQAPSAARSNASAANAAAASKASVSPSWLQLLSNSVMQVSVDPVVFFCPSDSLSGFQQGAGLADIVGSFRTGCFPSSVPHPPLPPAIVFCLPSIQLLSQNLSSSGMRLSVQQTLPCLSQVRLRNQVDDVPIRQLQGECLPCAVALSGVSAFTVTPSRPEDKTAGSSLVDVSFVLRPTGLNALLGASQRSAHIDATNKDGEAFSTPSEGLSPSVSTQHQDSLKLLEVALSGNVDLSGQSNNGDLSGVVIHGNVDSICLELTQSQIQLMQSLAAGWLQMVVAIWQSSALLTSMPLSAGGIALGGSGKPAVLAERIAAHYADLDQQGTENTFSASQGADTSMQSLAGSQELDADVPFLAEGPVSSSERAPLPLTIWVQCALPLLQVCVRSSQTSITCTLEDLSASVDACGSDVDGRYLVGDCTIRHQVLGLNGQWQAGPCHGLLAMQGSPNLITQPPSEADMLASVSLQRQRVSRQDDSKSRAFLSLRYNTVTSLGTRSELVDDDPSKKDTSVSPWKGELHLNLKPCTLVAYCPALSDILQVFQLSADGNDCVRHVTTLLPMAARTLKKNSGLVLPCLFLDVHDISVLVPSDHGGESKPSPAGSATGDCDMIVINLERACVRPSPDNPIVPLILERVAQRSGEEEWKRSSLANQLVCKEVQLETVVSGLSVGVAPWSGVQPALQKMTTSTDGRDEVSSEADTGQVPALEWNKSETQERVASASVVVPLLTVPHCQLTMSLAWHLSQLSNLLPSCNQLDFDAYKIGNLIEVCLSQVVSVDVSPMQLMACLSVWRTNIQPLITVIQDLFLHHSMGSVADTELQERRTFSSHQTPPMAPPTATRPGFGGSIPFELSLTGQGVVCTLSFPDVGVWSANIQQPVLMYSYLLSSMALQMSVHDLKLTVCPKDARGVVAVVETRRGSSVSRSGVTPSFFKLGCHTKTLTMQAGFTPDHLDLKFGRPVRVSITTQILDTFLCTANQLTAILCPVPSVSSSLEVPLDSSSVSLGVYETPLETPIKLGEREAGARPTSFPLSVRLSTSQIVLEVFGAGDSHVQLVLGASELRLTHSAHSAGVVDPCQSMSGQFEGVALSACLVSSSLVSPAATCRQRLVLPFALQTGIILWQSLNQALCCQVLVNVGDLHAFMCQKRLADLQILAQSLQEAGKRLAAVRTSKEVVGSTTTAEFRYSDTVVASDKVEVDQLVCYQLMPKADRFSMPDAGHVVFWTDNNVSPARASMTWCYSLPRHVHSIDVTPVPWEDSSPAAVPAELQVWSAARKCFVPVLTFDLRVSSLTQLPVDSQHASSVWRVEACCVTEHVVPQLLVACILINSSVAHVLDLAAVGTSIQLHLFNAYTGMDAVIPGRPPTQLHKSFPAVQEFAVLSFRDWLAASMWQVGVGGGGVFAGKPSLSASTEMQLNVVDFSTRQLLPFAAVEPISLRLKDTLSVELGRCSLQLCQSALHTVHRTSQLWRVVPSEVPMVKPARIGLSETDVIRNSTGSLWTSSRKYTDVFLHHYLVINDTSSTLLVGQSGTDECLVLEPGERLAYSWRESSRPRTLQVATRPSAAIVGPENTHPASPTKWCEPFGVDSPQRLARWVLMGWITSHEQRQVYADEPARLVIDVASMTTMQQQVIFRGTAHFSTYMPKNLEVNWWYRSKVVQAKLDEQVQHKLPATSPDVAKALEQDKEEYKAAQVMTVDSMTSTRSWFVPDSCVLVMKIRLAGAEVWSGAVPYQCLPEGHQFQTMAVPTGLEWPLIQVYFHMRVVNYVRGCMPLMGCLSPLLQVRNHMPWWCAVHMSHHDEQPFGGWVPPVGGQLHINHLAINECYNTGFQIKGLDLMSPAALPMTCEMRQDIPTVQPKLTTDVRLLTPEQRKEDGLQVAWPHINPTGAVGVDISRIATTQFNRDYYMLKYVEVTVGPTRPFAVVDALEPVVPQEAEGESAGEKGSEKGSKHFQRHFSCTAVVAVHRLNHELETLQLEVAPWCLIVNKTKRVILFSTSRDDVVTIPPQNVIVPAQFNWGFNVGTPLDGKPVWSRHLIQVAQRLPNKPREENSATVQTLSNDEQYRKLAFYGERSRLTMIAFSCARFGTQNIVISEHFVLVNQTGHKLLAWSACCRDLVPAANAVCVTDDEDDCTALAPSPFHEGISPDPMGPFLCLAIAPEDEDGRLRLPVAFDADSCSTAIPLGNEVLRQPFGVPLLRSDARTYTETSADGSSTLDKRSHEPAAPLLCGSLPLVVCVQPHQGTNYAVVGIDKAPQFLIENHGTRALLCQEVSGSDDVGLPLRLPPLSSLHWQPPSAVSGYPRLVASSDRPSVQIRLREEFDDNSRTPAIEISRPCLVQTQVGHVRVVHGLSACSRVVISSEAPPDPIGIPTSDSVEEKASISVQDISVVLHQGLGSELSPSLGLCLQNVLFNLRTLHHSAVFLALSVGYMQVENLQKSEEVDFPVILARQMDPISERARQYLPSSSNVDNGSLYIGVELLLEDYFPKKVVVQLPKLVVHVEDVLLAQLTALASFAGIVRKEVEDHTAESALKQVSLQGLPRSLAAVIPNALHPLQIGEWSVADLHIMLTMQTSAKVFVSVDRSPVRLEQFRLWPGVSSPVTVLETASVHYVSGGLASLGWLVSSLELLGSPGGLFRSVGDGVRDFVQLPYQGLAQGPGSFLTGLSGGTTSLLRHTSAGVISSLSHFAESAARNLDTLSFDAQHAAQQKQLRRQSQVGLRTGMYSLGMAWLGAVAGLASHPLQPFLSSDNEASAEKKKDGQENSGHGVAGGVMMVGSSLVGVGRGLMGAITKPVSGAMDLIAHTGQGLLTSMDLVASLDSHMVAVPLLPLPSTVQRVLRHCLLEDVVWFTPCIVTATDRKAMAEQVQEDASYVSHHQCIMFLSQSSVYFVRLDSAMMSSDWLYPLVDVEFRDLPSQEPFSPGDNPDEVIVCLLPHSHLANPHTVPPLLADVHSSVAMSNDRSVHDDCLLHFTLPSPLSAKVLFAFAVVLSKQHHFYIA